MLPLRVAERAPGAAAGGAFPGPQPAGALPLVVGLRGYRLHAGPGIRLLHARRRHEATRWRYTLRPVDGGTEIVQSFEWLQEYWLLRPFAVVFKARRQEGLIAGMQTTLGALKRVAEAAAVDASPGER